MFITVTPMNLRLNKNFSKFLISARFHFIYFLYIIYPYKYIQTTDKRCSSVGRPAELSHTLPLFVTFRIRNFNIWIEKIVCASRGSFVCYYISQMSTVERWRILPRLSPDNERSHISHLTTMWDCCFIPAGSSAGSPVFRQVRGEEVVRRI